MNQAILIPPNSNFLKTLANFFLTLYSLKDIKITKVWCIFPNQRAGLYFKHYLKEKTKSKNEACFLPRIFSFKEFIETLYSLFSRSPSPQISEILQAFIFLETLSELENNQEKNEEYLEKQFFWSLKFLEVFEEFEKEGKIPQNLIYPPEELPEIAKKLFEKLKTAYLKFTSLLENKGYSYPSYQLKKLYEISNYNQTILKSLAKELDEVWFIGFAALREAEAGILRAFKKIFKTYFIFEAGDPPPLIIQETLKKLELNYELLDPFYYEVKNFTKPKIYFYQTSDPHLEIKSALNLISQNATNPDEIAIVVPNSLNLLPLIYELEESENNLEVNITLQYPITKHPLNQLLRNIIKAQKERENGYYPTSLYLKILKHPYLWENKINEIPLKNIVKEIENKLRKKGYLKIKLEEIEDLFPEYNPILRSIHKIFFENWEKPYFHISENLKEILNFFRSFFEKVKDKNDWHSILLRNFLYVLETKIFPVFEEEYLKKNNFSKKFFLSVLEYLLKEEKVPFSGNPLKGLQIMGFLETRLLSFKKLIILDVNEGILPPTPSLNPLLTDEIKTYLGLPIHRNELWVYYFDNLINSSEEIHLFYLFVEKGKTLKFKEPSRFILKLKWEMEKEGVKTTENIIPLKIEIFSEKKGIPKSEKEKERLLKLIKSSEISRYFIETYLNCGVKFYFKYLLGLKEPEKLGLHPADIGNFMHEFFERFLKNWENKEILINQIYNKEKIIREIEDLWEKYQFRRKMDALSYFFSKKIAIKAILKYFEYLLNLEKTETVKNITVLGVEKNLQIYESLNLFHSEDSNKVLLKGKVDFLIRREEKINKSFIPKYLILDYKSNPYIYTNPQKALNLLHFKLPENYDQDSIYEIASVFGQNFQLLFYYYLFYQQRENFIKDKDFVIIDTGFIVPTNFEKPENLVFSSKKNLSLGEWKQIYFYFENDFKKLIEWILNHIIISDKFYFPPNENTCRYCEYKTLCKNYRYLLD